MKFLLPIILIGMSITMFFMFISPAYTEINDLQLQSTSYNDALANSKALEAEKDKLTTKYSSIDPNNLKKLSVLLPDSVDNIRLILEIEKLALPYGMALTDVKYSTNSTANTPADQAKLVQNQKSTKNYGDWDLEFSTTGTYSNFVSFLRDLEKNLRIVDVTSIDFSSMTGAAVNGVALSTVSPDTYKYTLKVKTYWLKN